MNLRFPLSVSAFTVFFSLLVSCDSTGGGGSGVPASSNSLATFVDARDGKVYPLVVIGSQTWMARNLDFAAPGSGMLRDSPDTAALYGRLYDWAQAVGAPPQCSTEVCPPSLPRRGICPEGWHLPSSLEWEILALAVRSVGWPDSAVGAALKSTTGWPRSSIPVRQGTDEFRFSALPSGFRYHGDSYGFGAEWWLPEEDPEDPRNAFFTAIYFNYDWLQRGETLEKFRQMAVRCVKDR